MLRFLHRRCDQLALASVSILGSSSCLQINPDYTQLPHRDEAIHEAAPSTTSSTGVEPTQSPTDAEAEMTTQEDPTSTSDLTSTDPTSSSISSTKSTSSSGLGPVPANWRAITINAQQVTKEVNNGYVLDLDFNHQSLVAAGAAIDGSDLSIVVRRGNTQQSLNRVLDPESNWNSTSTKIWFAINEPIPQGTLNNTEYYLVLGDPSLRPISNPETLFFVFDDFENDQLDTSRWDAHTSSVGTRSLSKTSEGLKLTAHKHLTFSRVHYSIRHIARNLPEGVRVDVKSRYRHYDIIGTCGSLFPLSLKSQPDDKIRAGLRNNLSDYSTVFFDETPNNTVTTTLNSAFPREGSWLQYSMTWVEQELRFLRGGSQINQTQGRGTVTRPNLVPMQLELSAGVRPGGCLSSFGRVELDFDWVRMRPYMHPEPSARLD